MPSGLNNQMKLHLNYYPANIFMPTAYIQMHPRQLYMNNPDQTGPKGAVLSGFILFARYVSKVNKQM